MVNLTQNIRIECREASLSLKPEAWLNTLLTFCLMLIVGSSMASASGGRPEDPALNDPRLPGATSEYLQVKTQIASWKNYELHRQNIAWVRERKAELEKYRKGLNDFFVTTKVVEALDAARDQLDKIRLELASYEGDVIYFKGNLAKEYEEAASDVVNYLYYKGEKRPGQKFVVNEWVINHGYERRDGYRDRFKEYIGKIKRHEGLFEARAPQWVDIFNAAKKTYSDSETNLRKLHNL